jgi:phosphoribosylformylglycinamidine cyclo-ligase
VAPGLSYGEALLAPTTLYSPVTEALAQAGVTMHYCANITGHGWRKLLRHPSAQTYRIHSVPAVPPVLKFIQAHAHHDDREVYSTLNMGAGFALFVKAQDAQRTVEIARSVGVEAILAGQVEAGAKQVVIEPIGVTFSDEDLQLR